MCGKFHTPCQWCESGQFLCSKLRLGKVRLVSGSFIQYYLKYDFYIDLLIMVVKDWAMVDAHITRMSCATPSTPAIFLFLIFFTALRTVCLDTCFKLNFFEKWVFALDVLKKFQPVLFGQSQDNWGQSLQQTDRLTDKFFDTM